jgi:hypothetical protein
MVFLDPLASKFRAVCFIASPLSDFMTGTTFRIEGGATPTV